MPSKPTDLSDRVAPSIGTVGVISDRVISVANGLPSFSVRPFSVIDFARATVAGFDAGGADGVVSSLSGALSVIAASISAGARTSTSFSVRSFPQPDRLL